MKISQKIAGWLALSSLMFTPVLFADEFNDELQEDGFIEDDSGMPMDDVMIEEDDDEVALRVRVNAGWGPRWRGGGYYYRPYYRGYQPYYYGPSYYYYRW